MRRDMLNSYAGIQATKLNPRKYALPVPADDSLIAERITHPLQRYEMQTYVNQKITKGLKIVCGDLIYKVDFNRKKGCFQVSLADNIYLSTYVHDPGYSENRLYHSTGINDRKRGRGGFDLKGKVLFLLISCMITIGCLLLFSPGQVPPGSARNLLSNTKAVLNSFENTGGTKLPEVRSKDSKIIGTVLMAGTKEELKSAH